MRGLAGGLFVATALAVAAAPAQGAESGVNIALYNRVDGPSNAQRLRVGWVRQFVGWSLGEPSRGSYDRAYLDRLASEMAAYRARGIKTLFAVQDCGSPCRTSAWAPATATTSA